MVKEYDNIGVTEAMDNLNKCRALAKKLNYFLNLKNDMIANNSFEKIEKIDRIEKKLLKNLTNVYYSYLKIIKDYGLSVYIKPENLSSSKEEKEQLLKDGFQLLNEASGLKLGLALNDLEKTLLGLKSHQENNLEVYQDRLKYYDLTLKSITTDKDSHTYGPNDEGLDNEKTGRSLLLNKIV